MRYASKEWKSSSFIVQSGLVPARFGYNVRKWLGRLFFTWLIIGIFHFQVLLWLGICEPRILSIFGTELLCRINPSTWENSEKHEMAMTNHFKMNKQKSQHQEGTLSPSPSFSLLRNYKIQRWEDLSIAYLSENITDTFIRIWIFNPRPLLKWYMYALSSNQIVSDSFSWYFSVRQTTMWIWQP